MSIDFTQTKKCILPWIHFNVETDGNVYPCCEADQRLEPLGNINEMKFDDIWNGDRYLKLRNQMINEEEPEYCKGCYHREKNLPPVVRSKRIRENTTWSQYWARTTSARVNSTIPYVDLRFNNLCNLKCRFCYPTASSSIASEQKQIGLIPEDSSLLRQTDSANVFEMLEKNINDLEEIYFVGGEPLIMEQHYKLLKMLIDSGNTNVRLRYNTNVSRFHYKSENVLDYWKHFDNISVNASVDHYGKKLEYIRHGVVWNEMLSNLQIISKMPNITLKIHCLLCVFNALDIFEIFQTFVSLGIVKEKNFDIGLLFEPEYYSVQSLNPSLKPLVEESVNKIISDFPNVDEYFKMNLSRIVKHMHEEDKWVQNLNRFKENTNTLDKIRNENFLITFPELRAHIYG